MQQLNAMEAAGRSRSTWKYRWVFSGTEPANAPWIFVILQLKGSSGTYFLNIMEQCHFYLSLHRKRWKQRCYGFIWYLEMALNIFLFNIHFPTISMRKQIFPFLNPSLQYTPHWTFMLSWDLFSYLCHFFCSPLCYFPSFFSWFCLSVSTDWSLLL